MHAVADPDLELRGGGGGGGLDLLAMSAIFPSVISSFLPKIRGARPPRAPPLDPPLICRGLWMILRRAELVLMLCSKCRVKRFTNSYGVVWTLIYFQFSWSAEIN